jgi:hypothetical protein
MVRNRARHLCLGLPGVTTRAGVDMGGVGPSSRHAAGTGSGTGPSLGGADRDRLDGCDQRAHSRDPPPPSGCDRADSGPMRRADRTPSFAGRFLDADSRLLDSGFRRGRGRFGPVLFEYFARKANAGIIIARAEKRLMSAIDPVRRINLNPHYPHGPNDIRWKSP